MTRPTRPKASTALLIILLCAMGAGPLFNYGISVSSSLIIDILDISAGQLGLVVTVVFASAALSSVSLGKLADRISARTQMLLIFGGTALSLVVAALAGSYGMLLAAAVVAGPGQSISNPTTNRVIMRAVAYEKRTGWIGIKQSGVQASQLFAGLFFPSVALAAGWTGAALGAALVCALLWLWSLTVIPAPQSLPAPEPRPARKNRRDQQNNAENAEKLPPVVYITALIGFLSGMGMQATNVYLPLFAVEDLGFSLVMGGVAASVSGIIGVVSRIGWSRRMQAGAQPAVLLGIISVGALFGVLAFLGAGTFRAVALLWIGAALHGITVLGANVVINAGLVRIVPAHSIGNASGINSMGMYSGFALGPLLMGGLHDLTGGFTLGWVYVGISYLVCGAVAWYLHVHTTRQQRKDTT